MSTEVQAAKKWLANLLQNDVTLTALIPSMNIFVDQAYRELGFPYILITYQGGIDKLGLGTVRELTTVLFQIRVVSQGPPDDNARSAESRMDSLLQTAVSQSSGGYYFTSRRNQPIDRSEYDDFKRVRYHSLGGIYKIIISKIP